MAVLGIPILEDKYPVTMDMWPIQAKEFNRIYPFYENLKQGKFTTTRCAQCGSVSYPPRVICPACYGEELAWVELPQEGKVLTFAEEMKGVPLGFEAPLIHALIDLGELSPVKRLLSRIINCPAGTLKEGAEVKLVVFEVPAHPLEVKRDTVMAQRVFFAFEPKEK